MGFRAFAFLCFLFFGVATASAQQFNNSYDFTGGPEGITSFVIEPKDSSYLVTGSYPTYPGRNFFIMKIDVLGDTVWSKHYGNGHDGYYVGLVNSINQVDSNKFIVAGSVNDTLGNTLGIIYMFNQSGDTLFTKRFNFTGEHIFNSTFVISPDSILVVGYTWIGSGNNNIIAMCVDSLGNIHWQNTYGDPGMDEFGYYISANTTDVLIGGRNAPVGNNVSDVYIISCNLGGDQLWYETFGESYSDFGGGEICPDGNYLVHGSMQPDTAGSAYAYLAKISPSQNVLWEKVFPFNYQRTDAIVSVIQFPSGEIVAAGQFFNTESPDYYEAFLLKTDENGEELWRRTYRGREGVHTYVATLKRTADNGFAICGYVYPDGVNSQDGWLLKVDSVGCLVTNDCEPVGIIQPEAETEKLLVYPNPASQEFTVSNLILRQGQHDKIVKIYNSIGQQVYLQPINHELSINVANWQNGIYYVVVGEQKAKIVVAH